ncbi:MAG: hypothetical protein JXA99_02850 [Candidatus Lokiarchaeota archaeon]|nr:hypothetical protein [Candidatus Lokiarchaeota archaeon]
MEITKILFIITSISEILVLYSIIILLEIFEKDVQFSKTQVFLTIFAFLIIGGLISTPQLIVSYKEGIYSVDLSEHSILGLLESLFSLSSFIILFLMLYKSRKTAWSRTQKHLIALLSLGIFLTIFLPIIPYLVTLFSDLDNTTIGYLHIPRFFFQNIGMILIGFTFFQASKKPWLLQRQRIHILLVYSETGIQLYSKIFGKELKDRDSELLTGAFSAISSLLKEATKTSGNIESIILEGRELKIIKKDYFLCALIVDYTTQASEMAHNYFANDFEKEFSDELKNFMGDISMFGRADSIAKIYFFE